MELCRLAIHLKQFIHVEFFFYIGLPLFTWSSATDYRFTSLSRIWKVKMFDRYYQKKKLTAKELPTMANYILQTEL